MFFKLFFVIQKVCLVGVILKSSALLPSVMRPLFRFKYRVYKKFVKVTHWNADTPPQTPRLVFIMIRCLCQAGSSLCCLLSSPYSLLSSLVRCLAAWSCRVSFSQQQQFSMLCAELLTKFASRQTTANYAYYRGQGKGDRGPSRSETIGLSYKATLSTT